MAVMAAAVAPWAPPTQRQWEGRAKRWSRGQWTHWEGRPDDAPRWQLQPCAGRGRRKKELGRDGTDRHTGVSWGGAKWAEQQGSTFGRGVVRRPSQARDEGDTAEGNRCHTNYQDPVVDRGCCT